MPVYSDARRLKDNTALGLLRGTQTADLEAVAALQNLECLALAGRAREPYNLLLCCLGLLVEDGLGLTTKTSLLTIIASLTLGQEGVLALLVERGLVDGMLSLALTEGPALCWICHHVLRPALLSSVQSRFNFDLFF